MKEKSIWLDSVNLQSFPSLKEDINTDVLIIGGGISGLLCAYELKKRNINYVLLEQHEIARKTSKDTTAFVTAFHETLYQDIIKKFGIDKAKQYLNLNLKAIEQYENLSKIYSFDFKKCNSTIYSKVDKDIIIKEHEALKTLGYESELLDKIPINIPISLAVTFKDQATINPLKFINEISKNLNIYEKSKVYKIKDNVAYITSGHKVFFNKVVIATHYPIINKKGLYFMKLTQRRSYVLAFENEYIDGTYFNIDDNGIYYRSYDKYLIIGGNDRDTNKEATDLFYNKIKDKKIDYYWSGQDCITLDGLPYIGRLSSLNKNYFVITGFNLWGFTLAMASSFVISDLIENKNEDKYEVVNPSRTIFRKQLFKNLITTLKSLLSLKKPRCKHMGCALKYNKYEKTWECPCHGSRYDINGNVIDGPSMKNISKK